MKMKETNRDLIGSIIARFKSQKEFAKALDISSVSLSNKLSGKAKWKLEEVIKSKILLKLSDSDVAKYFNLW